MVTNFHRHFKVIHRKVAAGIVKIYYRYRVMVYTSLESSSEHPFFKCHKVIIARYLFLTQYNIKTRSFSCKVKKKIYRKKLKEKVSLETLCPQIFLLDRNWAGRKAISIEINDRALKVNLKFINMVPRFYCVVIMAY